MKRQQLIQAFTFLLIAGAFAFYLGRHLDRQFSLANTFSPLKNPFAPLQAGLR